MNHATKNKPAHVLLHDEIDMTPTRGSERSMLLAGLRWVNTGTRRLWPAVKSWGEHAGLSERAARNAIKRLSRKGCLHKVGKSKFSTTIYEMLPRDSAAHGSDPHEPEGGGTGEPADLHPAPAGVQTLHPAPARGAPKPSMHPPTEPTREPPRSKGGGSASRGWMDGRSPESCSGLHAALQKAGIRGRNLQLLAESSLTVEDVERERRDVERDGGVRSNAAVLTKRLAGLAGIELAKRPGLGLEAMECVGNIERLRRRRSGGAR